MNNQVLVVFDQFYQALAQISLSAEGKIKFENLLGTNDQLHQLVENLANEPLTVRAERRGEDGVLAGMIKVSPKDGQFLWALGDRLGQAGFFTAVLPGKLKGILTYFSTRFTLEQREKILPELANIPAEITDQEVADLQGLLLDIVDRT